jgi:hypothetical protein
LCFDYTREDVEVSYAWGIAMRARCAFWLGLFDLRGGICHVRVACNAALRHYRISLCVVVALFCVLGESFSIVACAFD